MRLISSAGAACWGATYSAPFQKNEGGVFKDKAGADESVALAAEFVRAHMALLLRQKPEVIEGSIKAHD